MDIKNCRQIYSILAATAALLLAFPSSHAREIPVEEFLKDPIYRQAKLSPDGKHLAILVLRWNTLNLATINLETNQPLVITREAQDISQYHWVNSQRLIYMTDRATDERLERTGGIFAIDSDGKNRAVLVTPPLGEGGDKAVYNPVWTRFLGLHPDDDNLIFVTSNKRDRRYPDIFTIDTRNGRERRHLINEWNARAFFLDSTKVVRFAVEFDIVKETKFHFLNPDTDKWEVLMTTTDITANWTPVSFNPADEIMYVAHNFDRDTTAVFRFNWKTREMDTTPVLEEDNFDIDPVPLAQGEGKDMRVVGFYYETDKPKRFMIDPAMERLHKSIDATLPLTFNRIISSREDAKMFLIQGNSDRIMPTFSLLDLTKGSLNELAYVTPWIDHRDLTERQPFSFTASDGQTIHGYLTLPKSWEAGKPVPLMVNPHGGPWARDTWALDWYFSLEPHFYANRGFAVIQVNFRGSTGFGRQFSKQSDKNIGRMHADVMEAVDWAIQQGYAHPDRLAIGGASWGGFQTMLALTKEAERFKFGINIFGVVDLNVAILRYIKWGRQEGYDYWVKRFADPKTSEGNAYLAEWSPLTHINNIKAPVFIYHGLRDFNVDIEQTRMLVSALDRLNHPYVIKLDMDEMHSMENEALRMEVYTMIDEFMRPFRAEWGMINSQ